MHWRQYFSHQHTRHSKFIFLEYIFKVRKSVPVSWRRCWGLQIKQRNCFENICSFSCSCSYNFWNTLCKILKSKNLIKNCFCFCCACPEEEAIRYCHSILKLRELAAWTDEPFEHEQKWRETTITAVKTLAIFRLIRFISNCHGVYQWKGENHHEDLDPNRHALWSTNEP